MRFAFFETMLTIVNALHVVKFQQSEKTELVDTGFIIIYDH